MVDLKWTGFKNMTSHIHMKAGSQPRATDK